MKKLTFDQAHVILLRAAALADEYLALYIAKPSNEWWNLFIKYTYIANRLLSYCGYCLRREVNA